MPTTRQIGSNPLLTSISTKFIQDASNFVGSVVPDVPVPEKEGRYKEYSKEDFLRIEAKERAPGAPPNYADFGITESTYRCRRDNIAKRVNREEQAQYTGPQAQLNQDRDALGYLTQQSLMRKDQRISTTIFGTGIWDIDVDGVAAAPGANQFLQFDVAGARPIQTIKAFQIQFHLLNGVMPNGCVMGLDVFNVLTEDETFLDKIKHTGIGIVDMQLMADVFGWDQDKFVVAKGIQNTAAQGQAGVYTSIFNPKSMLLFYVPDAPSRDVPSAFYNFTWSEFDGAGPAGNSARRWTDEEADFSEVYEHEISHDPKVVASSMGAFLENAVG